MIQVYFKYTRIYFLFGCIRQNTESSKNTLDSTSIFFICVKVFLIITLWSKNNIYVVVKCAGMPNIKRPFGTHSFQDRGGVRLDLWLGLVFWDNIFGSNLLQISAALRAGPTGLRRNLFANFLQKYYPKNQSQPQPSRRTPSSFLTQPNPNPNHNLFGWTLFFNRTSHLDSVH